MNNNLIIVFLKNAVKGKVKTRLAKEIGEDEALHVYHELLAITKSVLDQVTFADIHLYFSDELDKSSWGDCPQFMQSSGDLGVKMRQAFETEFANGYDKVIGIGSDLPELNVELLQDAFLALKKSDTVFGPAADGGYYLLGMNKLYQSIFTNKNWSTDGLYEETKQQLIENNVSLSELEKLNDIDTLEDLRASSLSSKCPY